MESKRLIYKDDFGDTHTTDERINGKFIGDKAVREKLFEYEQEESGGKLIHLPCKVGNTLYMLNRNKSNIQEMTLDKPDIRCHCIKDDEFSSCMPICNDKENGICAYRFHLDFSEIGKTVFLTREEAERSLKERENNG